MRLKNKYPHLTLVLFVILVMAKIPLISQAAPSTEIVPEPVPVIKTPPQEAETSNQAIDSLAPSDPGEDLLQKKYDTATEGSLFFQKENQWRQTFYSAGFVNGTFNKDKSLSQLTTFSIGRSHYDLQNSALEFGLMISTNQYLGPFVGKKWLHDWPMQGLPYLRAFVQGFYDPKDQLANIVDYQRYSVGGAFGFDDALKMKKRFRAELGGGFSSLGTMYFFNFIFSKPDQY